MPPKRKNGSEEQPTGREKKKQKIAAAREIAVQSVKTVSSIQGSIAESSERGVINSLQGLPSAIDVEKFTEARAFEISAMQDAMKNASGSSTSRAWQALPRHLRRRAASHDVRRVPLRLREKARAEMDPIRKKALGRSIPKLSRKKRLTRTEILMKRQRDKLWLETHLWHAKRMRMQNMWGYRLAVHPTEKSFRPSHRAAVHGSILHDASYYSLIELKGPFNILKTILEACCDPQGSGPGAIRYISGSRCLNTHFYPFGSYPCGLIAPITVIWKPVIAPSPAGDSSGPVDESPENTTSSNKTQQPKRKRKRKKKGKEIARTISTPNDQDIRIAWLHVHPSAFDDVISTLRTAASAVLNETRSKCEGGKEIEFEIADLRGEVNVFEIMGPKSNQVLKGALTPILTDSRVDFQKFWSRLGDWQTSGELTRGMVIGFKVYDPRLKFPPKNAKPSATHTAPGLVIQPSPALAASEIWDEGVRNCLAKPRFKKKDLDERRARLLIPGTPLQALRQDDRIPILLVQRSLEGSGSLAQGIHGWTLIIPTGWSMAFFNSLTFTGTRVGGQRERQTQAFEAGVVYFPRDFPGSSGYETYAAAREEEETAKWLRKPPAKRTNFEKLGTRNPWRTDWEVVLGLPSTASLSREDFVTTQREEGLEMMTDKDDTNPWLLRGVDVPAIITNVSKMFIRGAGLLEEINRLRMKRGHEPLLQSKGDQLLKTALVSVRVIMLGRGVPNDLAMLYSVTDDQVKAWNRTVRQSAAPEADLTTDSEEQETEAPSDIPPDSLIIGYVTSGHFSLSRGQGSAVGAVSLVKLLELLDQSQRLSSRLTKQKISAFVMIRNGNSRTCRPALIGLLDG